MLKQGNPSRYTSLADHRSPKIPRLNLVLAPSVLYYNASNLRWYEEIARYGSLRQIEIKLVPNEEWPSHRAKIREPVLNPFDDRGSLLFINLGQEAYTATLDYRVQSSGMMS